MFSLIRCFFLFLLLTGFAAHAQPKVVVTIPALHSLALQVMQGVATPVLLLNARQDAHHFQLKPSQMRAVLAADLFVYYDPAFEHFVPALAESAQQNTKFLALSGVLGRDKPHHQDYGWLSPDYAIAMVHFLAVELGKIDPEHAARYTKNAMHSAAVIDALATQWRATLKTPTRIAVDHDAFTAFREYFSLPPMLTLEEAGGELSLRRLKTLEKNPPACILATHGESPLLATLAETLAIPLLFPPSPLGEGDYLKLMEAMVRSFQECTAK